MTLLILIALTGASVAQHWKHLESGVGYYQGEERLIRSKEPVGPHGLVEVSTALLGVPYQWSGDDPVDGFDSSGFVWQVLRLNGYAFPRGIDKQLAAVNRVRRDSLEPGHLVFFSDSTGGLAQVGIYLGEGLFAHASPRAGQVVLSELNEGYFSRHFLSGGELPGWTGQTKKLPENYAATLPTTNYITTYTTTVKNVDPPEEPEEDTEKVVKPYFRRPDNYYHADINHQRSVFEPYVTARAADQKRQEPPETSEEALQAWRLRLGEVVSVWRSFLPLF